MSRVTQYDPDREVLADDLAHDDGVYGRVPVIETVSHTGTRPMYTRVYVEHAARHRSTPLPELPASYRVLVDTPYDTTERIVTREPRETTQIDAQTMDQVYSALLTGDAGVVRDINLLPDRYLTSFLGAFNQADADPVLNEYAGTGQNIFRYMIGGEGGRIGIGFGSIQTAENELFRPDESFDPGRTFAYRG